MTKEQFKNWVAGKYVLQASRNVPLNYGLLDSYIAGALAAYEYLKGETDGLENALKDADESIRTYLSKNLERPK